MKYSAKTGQGSDDYLGEGEFGRVYKARLMNSSDETAQQPKVVAMKIVKLSNDKAKKKYQKKEIDFIIEAERKIVDLTNIICYYAFVEFTKVKEYCVYMELCEDSLHDFLQDQPDISLADLRHVAHGVLSGLDWCICMD